MSKAMEGAEKGAKIEGKLLKNVKFADDKIWLQEVREYKFWV